MHKERREKLAEKVTRKLTKHVQKTCDSREVVLLEHFKAWTKNKVTDKVYVTLCGFYQRKEVYKYAWA